MIRKDNYEQKTFDCETRYYNKTKTNSVALSPRANYTD
jgi:hypothetical protein